MKNNELVIKVATFFRDESVKALDREIRRLEEKHMEYQAMDGDRCVDMFFPLDTEVQANGSYKCRSGVTEFEASKAAGMLADLRNEFVSFDHNGKLRVEFPRTWVKP